MKLKRTNSGILIKGRKVSVLIANKPEKVKEGDADLIFSPTELDIAQIDRPGEYEMKDVLVYALDPSNEREVTLWAIDIDDVKVVYITNKLEKVSKKALDDVGINHILIWDMVGSDVKKQSEFVFEFDPHIFVPIMEKDEKYDDLAKELGTKVNDPEASINAKATDFGEEPQLSVIRLKK